MNRQKQAIQEKKQIKSILNGAIEQDLDLKTDAESDLRVMTRVAPTADQTQELLFASKS